MARPHLSILIPAHNQARQLEETLPAVDDYLRRNAIDAEIVVVDDGSSDETAGTAQELLRGHRGHLQRNAERRGRGAAVRRGLEAAEGRWIFVTDAALSSPIEEHARLAAAARDRDLDVAFGSHLLPDDPGKGTEVSTPRLPARLMNGLLRSMTRVPYRDVLPGPKLLDRERTRPLFDTMVVDSCSFDAELLFLCHRLRLRAEEVPVVWRPEAMPGWELLAELPRALIDAARVRWRYRRGRYHASEVGPLGGAGAG